MIIVVVIVGQREELLLRAVDGLSPKLEAPVCETACVFVDVGILDHDSPVSDAVFTPMRDAHEFPVDVSSVRIILAAMRGNMRDHACGTPELDTQVATTHVLDVHDDGDMFDTFEVALLHHVLRHSVFAGEALIALRDCVSDMLPRRE